MGDRLRPLWDFSDLDATEARLRDALQAEATDEGRAEVLTQLARVEGLRSRFPQGDALLDEAAALARSSPLVAVRVDLERGRLRRSEGDANASLPLFERAFSAAVTLGDAFLAVDAAHMAAIAAPDLPAKLVWAERGIDIARDSSDPEVEYWLGPLYNNLGWDHFEAGEHETALGWFQRALEQRLREPDKPYPVAVARYHVGSTLRELGRPGEAAAQLEQAVAWAQGAGTPDGWFHEELARDYALIDRPEEAAEQARLALGLLPEQDGSFAVGGERAARLQALAGEA